MEEPDPSSFFFNPVQTSLTKVLLLRYEFLVCIFFSFFILWLVAGVQGEQYLCVSFPVFLEIKYTYYSGEFDLSIGLKIVKFFKGELYCFASVYGTDYGRPESK